MSTEDKLVNQVLRDRIVELEVELKAQEAHAEAKDEAIRTALRDKIIELELELDRVKQNDSAVIQRDLLQIELEESRHRTASLLEEIANLRDAIDGMADDMGQLESRLAELKGLDG